MLDEAVGNTQLQNRYEQPFRGQELAYCRACTPDGRVFLDRDDGPMALRQGDHEVLVHRFDEPHVDERGVEALGDLLRRVEQRAKYENREAATTFAARLRAGEGPGGDLLP